MPCIDHEWRVPEAPPMGVVCGLGLRRSTEHESTRIRMDYKTVYMSIHSTVPIWISED